MHIQIRRLSLLFFLLLALAGCEKATQKGEGGGRFGMMDTDTPEYAAQTFFEYIYNDKKLTRAVGLSTPRVAKLLRSYHTNKNVQRHVLNLSYDRNQVKVQPDTGNSVGRPEFAKEAQVTIFFTGKHNGEQKEDIREVEMVRIDSQWKVDKIKADKYL